MLAKESKTYLIVVAGAALVTAVSLVLSQKQPAQSPISSSVSSNAAAIDVAQSSPIANSQQILPDATESLVGASATDGSGIQFLINEIATRLVSDHSHEISNLSFQVTLKELREDLLIDHPHQGLQIFERILMQAFPDLAESILALLTKKDVYDTWLLSNMIDMNKMDLEEQKEMLWTKRYEVFGKADAEQIWVRDRDEKEERAEAMHTVLNMLNQSKDVAMHDRIYLLKSAYEENFFGTVEDLVLDSGGVLAQTIFSMDVVQEELGAMSAEERQDEIDSVRRQLGFDESQIAWLAQRDQEREQRWANGYAYMEGRSKLEASYEGEALERELDLLREKHFKEEAATIKKEEELIGFFRYTRQRVYGRN